MPSRPKHARALALLLLAALAGCASRTVPAQFPASAPASPGAGAAPPAQVTAALDGDPPLPGQPVTHWPGLDHEPRDSAPQPGGHHDH